MKNKNTTKGSVYCMGLLASLFLLACSKVDPSLGSGLLPDNDHMKVETMKITSVHSYTKRIDSLITSNWGDKYLGSVISSEFGRTNCGMVAQYIFNGFKNDSMWGDDPVIDSVVLALYVNGVIGDSLYHHTVEMYELNRKLPSTTKFYSNFDINAYTSPQPEKVFTAKKVGNYIRTHLPKEFGERFTDTTGRIYYVDSLFYEKYYGSYFKVRDNVNEGNLLSINMANSKISVYYHNKNKPIPDTSVFVLLYTNDATLAVNKSFTVVQHDYSLADPFTGVKVSTINDTLTPQTLTYVQGMAGLTTMLELNKTEIDALLQRVTDEGYKKIVVNSAILDVALNRPSIPAFNNSLNRLGMYYDYPNVRYIPDYNPYNETNSYQLPYDGYLNRAWGGYRFDIALYLQELLNEKDKNYKIDLSAAYNNEHFPLGSFLNNTTTQPITLTITYTMVK